MAEATQTKNSAQSHRRPAWCGCVAIHGSVLSLLLVAGSLHADEAVLKDGRRVDGTVTLTAAGRLAFSPKNNMPLPWDAIQRVDFADAPCPDGPLTGLRRILLPGEQSLTGKFVAWDKDGLRLHPMAMDQRVVAVNTILGMRHVPGTLGVLEDDFSDGLGAWKVEGKPRLLDQQNAAQKRILGLDGPGQSIRYVPTGRIQNGRVGVSFVLPESVAKGRWVIEAEFGDGPKARTVPVVFLGDGQRYVIQTPAAATKPQTCGAGRHHAWIEFGRESTLVVLDDTVMWQESVRPGELGALRLACTAVEGEMRAPFTVEGVSVARMEADPKHPSGPLDQDEIWLRSGDQLFGRITGADRREIDLEARGRHRKLAWSDVIGFYLRAGGRPLQRLQGEWVRVWLRTPIEGPWDELEGVLTKLDNRRVVLHHPSLGELSFGRSQLHRLRPLFFGERIELDNGAHHLGDEERTIASINPPRAEGRRLVKTFRVEAVPGTTRLLVTVVQLKGAGDGIATALERGELRTEVWVNNERVDYLNRLVDRAVARPQRLSVALPKKLLQVGENTLELRLTPEAGTDHYENCGVSQLMIETEP